ERPYEASRSPPRSCTGRDSFTTVSRIRFSDCLMVRLVSMSFQTSKTNLVHARWTRTTNRTRPGTTILAPRITATRTTTSIMVGSGFRIMPMTRIGTVTTAHGYATMTARIARTGDDFMRSRIVITALSRPRVSRFDELSVTDDRTDRGQRADARGRLLVAVVAL